MFHLLASAFVGATALLGSVFGIHHDAQQRMASSTPPFGQHMGSSTPGAWGGHGMGSTTPDMGGVMGKVTVINGTTLTLVGRAPRSTATTTYSVDASAAKVMKIGVGTTTVASIKAGDSLIVTGPVSGSDITAKLIIDGVMQMRPVDVLREPLSAHWAASSTQGR